MWKCSKNVTKTSKGVLCRGICTQWFHLKCTSLTQDEFNKIMITKKTWACNTCVSVDVTKGLENETSEINFDLTQELKTQSEIIKTLNEDLSQANEIIKQLRSHKIQLETMVLRKEETIVILERKLKLINIKSKDRNSNTGGLSVGGGHLHHSLPPIHSTPLCIDRTRNRAGSLDKNKHKSFALAVEGMNTENIPSAKINKNMGSSFLYNRFEALSIEDEEESKNIPSTTLKPNKMLICADSHGRDLALHINKRQKTFEAVGFVRPGGRTKQILNNKNVEEANLGKEDALVILCGTNDVARNEADEAIDGISTILEKAKQTRVLLVNLPNRYDLAAWSCVNSEVKKTNQRLQELSDKHSNVIYVDVNKADRHLHTRQGLHLNVRGKEWLAAKIVGAIDGKPENVVGPSDEQPPPPGTDFTSGNGTPPSQDKYP